MKPALAALLLLAVSARASERAKPAPMQLASPGLQSAGVASDKAAFYSSHLAQRLSLQPDLRCMTSTEIGALIGMERQKQLLGCDAAASSCVAELANALGVDGIVSGSIGLVGESYQLNVRILSARDGAQLAAASSSASDEQALLQLLNVTAVDLAAQLRKALGRPALVERSSGGLRRWFWIPAATGVAASAVGTYFVLQSENASARLRAASDADPTVRPFDVNDARRLMATGQRQQTIAQVAFAVGAAALATAAGFYLFGGEGDSAMVAIVPGGFAAAVSGSF